MSNSAPKESSTIPAEFEELLVEAVKRNSYRGVKMLLEYEDKIESCCVQVRKYKQKKNSNAMILAAQNGDYHLLKLFLKYQYTISPPHSTDCQCDKCSNDKLGKALFRVETLKGLSNPVWISLSSDDPFLASFKLCSLCKKIASEEDSFENSYKDIATKNESFCLDLLDEIENEAEGYCLMKHQKYDDDEDDDTLHFINLAIAYRQKEVVAHPIAQHFVTSQVFDKVPKWRTSGLLYKIFFVSILSLCYPLTVLCHIMLPCTSLGKIARKPLIKFVNGAASFITFLVLLTLLGATPKEGLRLGDTPSLLEIITLIWLIGLSSIEIRQLWESGIVEYFSNGWNWIDACMDILMLSSYVIWTAMYFLNPSIETTIRNFADGVFALAIVLSFFRVVYLCQITRYLGLLQLCLSRMVQVIFQFAFISVLVLLSFSVAMVFLFHSSAKYETIVEEYERDFGNRSHIYRMLMSRYHGLDSTIVTLTWAGLNMVGIKSLNSLNDGSLIQLWSNILFVVYYGVSMIVLLNMLIAMMSNSYQRIENNLEVEHKFSRTILWIDYIGEENIRPPPFNLIPTSKNFRRWYKCLKRIFSKVTVLLHKEENPSQHREAEEKYKDLCSNLLKRYLVKKIGYSIFDDNFPENNSAEDASLLRKINSKFLMWRTHSFLESTCGIDNAAFCDQSDDHLYTAVEGDREIMETSNWYSASI